VPALRRAYHRATAKGGGLPGFDRLHGCIRRLARRRAGRLALALACCGAALPAVAADAPLLAARALGDLSIEELAEVTVTSGSRRPQLLSEAAACATCSSRRETDVTLRVTSSSCESSKSERSAS
jgi:hypothetical protein